MEPKVTLELSINELNVVLTGLAKLPIEQGLETFTAVRNAAEAQLNQQPNEGPPPEGPLADKVKK